MFRDLLRHPKEERIVNVKGLVQKWSQRSSGDHDQQRLHFS